MWTQDEEGNFFIIYANGESVQKLSVSFNLDQMVEGIQNKEPSSPRINDGEFIDEECKFLPPPKTVGHPRLFLVDKHRAREFCNFDQLEHRMRTLEKDPRVEKIHEEIYLKTEKAINHQYVEKQRPFSTAKPLAFQYESPKMPQALDLVNQTVSILKEPETSKFTKKNIIEFQKPTYEQIQAVYHAIGMRDSLRASNRKEAQRLVVKPAQETQPSGLQYRIAKARNIEVATLKDCPEHKALKQLTNDKRREDAFRELDHHFGGQLITSKQSDCLSTKTHITVSAAENDGGDKENLVMNQTI